MADSVRRGWLRLLAIVVLLLPSGQDCCCRAAACCCCHPGLRTACSSGERAGAGCPCCHWSRPVQRPAATRCAGEFGTSRRPCSCTGCQSPELPGCGCGAAATPAPGHPVDPDVPPSLNWAACCGLPRYGENRSTSPTLSAGRITPSGNRRQALLCVWRN